VALIVEPDLELAAEDVKKLLAFVGVGFSAAASRFNSEKVRLHGGVAPGEQFHTNVRTGFQNFALGRANERRSVPVGFEHGQNVGFIETRDASKGGNRGAHLPTLECAEETHGNLRGVSDLREGESALDAQTPETLTERLARLGTSGNDSLLLQNMHNCGRI
jgi:hypothetical protein